MMGLWFLCIAIGYMVGGKLAALASVPADLLDPVETSAIYANNFMLFAYIAMGGAVLTFVTSPWIKKLSADKENQHHYCN